MKKIALLLAVLTAAIAGCSWRVPPDALDGIRPIGRRTRASASGYKSVYVRPHIRRNGSFVTGHYRSSPGYGLPR